MLLIYLYLNPKYDMYYFKGLFYCMYIFVVIFLLTLIGLNIVYLSFEDSYSFFYDPYLCRNATEYTNNHRNKYAAEITLDFINQ